LLERVVFGVGALMMLGSALLDTWGNARGNLTSGLDGTYVQSMHAQYPSRVARLLLASAIGLLLPLLGAVILLVGETILVLRLLLRDEEIIPGPSLHSAVVEVRWGVAFRAAASKWGLAVSMIAFAWTLQDRIAEVGAASSFGLWLALNIPAFFRSHSG